MIRPIATALALLVTTACQHNASSEPAVLSDGSEATLNALKAHLAEALGQRGVKLSANDLTVTPTVVVMPPPLGPHETLSTAMPILLTLMLENGICYAVRDETGEMIRLDGVPCRAL